MNNKLVYEAVIGTVADLKEAYDKALAVGFGDASPLQQGGAVNFLIRAERDI